MTLNQWLTSTYPAAMLEALGDQADERRKKQFVISCREHSEMCGYRHNWAIGINQSIVDDWAARPDYDVPFEIRCDLIRCLWPPPMMGRERVECGNCNWLGSIEAMDSICQLVECKMCKGKGFTLAPLINPRWRTPLVTDLARQARGGEYEFTTDDTNAKRLEKIPPNPELMPILADALMDYPACCDNEIITDHLRQPHHVPGECWVIGMLLNTERESTIIPSR